MSDPTRNAELIYESIYSILRVLIFSSIHKTSSANPAFKPTKEQEDALLRAVLSDERSDVSLKDRCYDIIARLQKRKPALVDRALVGNQDYPDFNLHYEQLIANLSHAWTDMFKQDVHGPLITPEIKATFGGQFVEDSSTTFDNLKQLMLYNAINRRISDLCAAIIRTLGQAQPANDEAAKERTTQQVTTVFIQPLLRCKSTTDYKNYLIAALKDLTDDPQNAYSNETIRRQLLNGLTEIYCSIAEAKEQNGEKKFSIEEDTAVRKAFNTYFVETARKQLLKLIADFKAKDSNWFEHLDPQDPLRVKIIALENEVTLDDGIKRSHDFENLIELVLEYSKEDANSKIRPLLANILSHFKKWFEDKPSLILLEDNPLIKTRIMVFQERLVSELTAYEKHRESSWWLNLTETFSSRSRTTKSERLAAVGEVKDSLTKPKAGVQKYSLASLSQTTQVINDILMGTVVNGVETPGIEADTSKLKDIIIDHQERIAKVATSTHVVSPQVTTINEKTNVRFNLQMAKDFEVYQKNRKPTGLVSYWWNQGIKKTWFEYLFPRDGDTIKRDNCLACATYLANKMKACKTSKDYVDFTLDIAYYVLTQNIDDKLKTMLITYQQLVIDRFVLDKADISFSTKQKVLMGLAMKRVGNTGQIYQELQRDIKNAQPEDAQAPSDLAIKNGFKELLLLARARIKLQQSIAHQDRQLLNVENSRIELQSGFLGEFLASKVIGSGKVAAANTGTAGNYAKLLTYVATINYITSIPIVSQVANAGAQVLLKIDAVKVGEEHKQNAALFTGFKQLEALITCLAYKITYRYSHQIQQLHPDDISMVMGCALERVMQFIGSGKVKELQVGSDEEKFEYLLNQLMMAVSNNELRHSTLPLTQKTIRNRGANGTYSTQDGWSIEGMFSEPGIVVFTANGPKYYAKRLDGNFVEPKYGYMVGTEAEATHYGMNPVEEGNKPAAEHPAAQEKVKALTQWVDTEKDIKSALDKLTNKVEALEKKVEGLESENKDLKELVKDLKGQVETLNSEKASDGKKIEELTMKIDLFIKASEKTDVKVEKLERTLFALLKAEEQKSALLAALQEKSIGAKSQGEEPAIALKQEKEEHRPHP